jgi:hypothetical protein
LISLLKSSSIISASMDVIKATLDFKNLKSDQSFTSIVINRKNTVFASG